MNTAHAPRSVFLRVFPVLLLALCGVAHAPASRAAQGHAIKILAVQPHDQTAFTQGLFIHAGKLYESTGLYGSSEVRIMDLASGAMLTRRKLSPDLFGEGLARLGDTAIQLTWKAHTGLIYDLATLQPLTTFRYQGQGWGLAASAHGLVMSNGSATLRFLDPATLQPVREIRVTENGREIRQLNELEWYGSVLLANVWHQDVILAIDPDNGTVLARMDLAALRARLPETAGVANGIAHDPATGKLFLTGKNWNKLFTVTIEPELQHSRPLSQQ